MGCLAAAVLVAASPADAAETLGFGELYQGYGALGLVFSDRLKALAGHDVEMRGFVAPPLKAESNFFVLTREPLSLCPFCSSDADWPSDIVVVYLTSTLPPMRFSEPVMVNGRLEVGGWTDPHTGFVSQIRLVQATMRRA